MGQGGAGSGGRLATQAQLSSNLKGACVQNTEMGFIKSALSTHAEAWHCPQSSSVGTVSSALKHLLVPTAQLWPLKFCEVQNVPFLST